MIVKSCDLVSHASAARARRAAAAGCHHPDARRHSPGPRRRTRYCRRTVGGDARPQGRALCTQDHVCRPARRPRAPPHRAAGRYGGKGRNALRPRAGKSWPRAHCVLSQAFANASAYRPRSLAFGVDAARSVFGYRLAIFGTRPSTGILSAGISFGLSLPACRARSRAMASSTGTAAIEPDSNPDFRRSASRAHASSTSAARSRLTISRSSKWLRSPGAYCRT